MLIDIDCDFDTWIFVAVAVELRIIELEKIKSTGTATDELCVEQLAALRKFSAEIKRKFRYEKSNSNEGVQQSS